jgi:cytochrome P450
MVRLHRGPASALEDRRRRVQLGKDLDLPYLTMEQDAFAADPFSHFTRARAQHPWLARWMLGYVVTDYDAMRDLFRDETRLRPMYEEVVTMMGARGTPWGEFQARHLLSQNGAAHKRLRDVVAFAFTPKRANMHRPLMREVITALLDLWAPKRAFNFEEFASYYPITVMFRQIGASPDAIPEVRDAMAAIGLSSSLDERYMPEMQAGVVTMEKFAAQLLADRRAGKRVWQETDLLDALLAAQDGSDLTDQELVDLLIVLFVGGYDTSKNMLTMIMRLMIDRPEIYARCAGDAAYSKAVVEEAFRYHSSTSGQRYLNEDIVYRDVLLEKDALVWFPFSVAMHDNRYATDADAFIPGRKTENRHIGFGLGPHMCIGQWLARAQIEEGFHIISQRILNPRLTGPYGFRPFPGVWGISGLPIEFDRAPGDVKEGLCQKVAVGSSRDR